MCGAIAGETLQAPLRPAEHKRSGETFGLSTLFMFITLVAVCLGVAMTAPGLGIFLAIVCVPAFIRAGARVTRYEASGQRTDPFDRFSFFLGSLGMILLIGLAGCAAFFAACLAACPVVLGTNNERLIVPFLILASIAALAVIVWLLRRTWPR
jgi:hypothetical protein